MHQIRSRPIYLMELPVCKHRRPFWDLLEQLAIWFFVKQNFIVQLVTVTLKAVHLFNFVCHFLLYSYPILDEPPPPHPRASALYHGTMVHAQFLEKLKLAGNRKNLIIVLGKKQEKQEIAKISTYSKCIIILHVKTLNG